MRKARKEAIGALAVRAATLITSDNTTGALTVIGDIATGGDFSATFGSRRTGADGRGDYTTEIVTMSRRVTPRGTIYRIKVPDAIIKQETPNITTEIEVRRDQIDIRSREVVPAPAYRSRFATRTMAIEARRRRNSERSVHLAELALNLLQEQQRIAQQP